MDDLLQSQIRDSCALALPEGLKDLMWDISREVLRAQPSDIIGFITEYLSALLISREHLNVASHLCGDVCKSACCSTLREDLVIMGFDEEKADDIQKLVQCYFTEEGQVHETSLLMNLINKFDVDENLIPAIKDAIRRAFLIHKYGSYHHNLCESSSESGLSEVGIAVKHTLRLFKDTQPSVYEYEQAATNIQAAYHAHSVRRHTTKTKYKDVEVNYVHPWNEVEDKKPTFGTWDSKASLARAISFEFADENWHKSLSYINTGRDGKSCRSIDNSESTLVRKSEEFIVGMKEEPCMYKPDKDSSSEVTTQKKCPSTSSLTGSLVVACSKPFDSDSEEIPEKENAIVDYTAEEQENKLSYDSNIEELTNRTSFIDSTGNIQVLTAVRSHTSSNLATIEETDSYDISDDSSGSGVQFEID